MKKSSEKEMEEQFKLLKNILLNFAISQDNDYVHLFLIKRAIKGFKITKLKKEHSDVVKYFKSYNLMLDILYNTFVKQSLEYQSQLPFNERKIPTSIIHLFLDKIIESLAARYKFSNGFPNK